jgi:hypothetical protein
MVRRWQWMTRATVAASFVLLQAHPGFGAVTLLSPKHPPTTNDLIYVGVPALNICSYTHQVTRNGFQIHIVISTGTGRCILGPPAGPSVEVVALGRLPPGAYSIDAFRRWDDEPPEFVGSLAVAVIALVPAVHPSMMMVLIAGIVGAGVIILSKRG